MRGRRRPSLPWLVAVVALVVAIAALLRLSSSGSDAPPEPRQAGVTAAIDAVPRGSLVVVTFDVTALRGTELGQALFGPARQMAGLGRVAERCGFDPASEVTDLAIAVPGGSGGDFLLAAGGHFDTERLLACSENMLSARGAPVVRERLGSFELVAGDGGPSGALAVRPGGPLLISTRPLVALAESVLQGRAPGVRDDERQARLRQLVGPGAVVASAVMTPAQRDVLGSAFEKLGLPADFGSIDSAAVALELGAELRLHAAVGCADEAGCQEVALLLETLRRRASEAGTPIGKLAERLGLAEVAAHVAIEPGPGTVALSLRLPASEARALAERLLLLGQLLGAEDEPPAAAEASATASAAASSASVPPGAPPTTAGAAASASPAPTLAPAPP